MRLSKALKRRHQEEISKRIPSILLGFRLVEDFALLLAYCYVFFAHELNDAPNRPHRSQQPVSILFSRIERGLHLP